MSDTTITPEPTGFDNTTATAAVTDRPLSPLRRVARFIGAGDGDVARVLILVVIVAVIAIAAPAFLSKASWLALSQAATVVVLLAIGQSFVIITGGIDLSVGAVMACSAIIGATVMRALTADGTADSTAILAGIGVTLAAGATMGLINGVVVTVLKITPFIATLGMLSVATGALNLISGGTEVIGLPTALGAIGNSTFAGGWLTIPVIVTIVVAVVAGLALKRTRFGMRTFAIGSNPGAARRAGLRVDSHLVRVYVLSGLLAGIAGFLLTSRFIGASPLAGMNAELASIAAAVIGGASLTGGRGSILGTVVGALITAALQIGLILAGVASFWQAVVIGIITVAAVFGDQIRIKLSGDR